MGKVFIKNIDKNLKLIDTNNGEMFDFIKTICIEEDNWFKLYINIFIEALKKTNSIVDIKVFFAALKCSKKNEENYNYFMTSDKNFRSLITEMDLSMRTIERSIIRLTENGFLIKKSRSEYLINPQIAFCGKKEERVKTILNITNKNDN